MATPKELANKARMTLAQALGPLQSADVPEELVSIAEPIAKTMGMLHRIEREGTTTPEVCAEALDNVRSALDALQRQSGVHPAVDAAMEAVAGSLSKLFALSKAVRPSSPPPEPLQQPVAPPAPQAAYQQAAPQAAYQPNPAFASAPQPAQAPPAPAYQAPAQPAYQAPAPAPQPAYQAPAQAAYQAPAPAPQPAPAIGVATPVGELNATIPIESHHENITAGAGPVANADAVVVELGAHSGSNFYKGLSGNDVIDHGGLFVATYKIPKLGSPVQLRVCLPGDLEFLADAMVQWTRDTRSGESEPGFGAKIHHISPEGRQLVYRYVRNREPMFYDDM